MDYRAKLVLFVDYDETVGCGNFEKMLDLYTKIRRILYEDLDATFDSHYMDDANCDKVEIAFNDVDDLNRFIQTDEYKELCKLCEWSTMYRKREAKNRKQREGS